MPLKTLFLNPPSFENFDGGAGSRWPATREIESFWYPVWLAYPAGMLEGARLLDAPSHHVSGEETIKIAKDYEFLVLFTSTPGFPGRHPAGAGDQEGESEDQDCVCGAARDRAAGEVSARLSGDRFYLPQGIRLLGGGLRQGQAAGGNSGRFVSEGREDRAQSGCAADSGSGRAAARDRSLQARSRCHELQRAVPAESVRVAIHHAGLPGAVHVLPVAADLERTSVAQALHRRRGRARWPRPKRCGRK